MPIKRNGVLQPIPLRFGRGKKKPEKFKETKDEKNQRVKLGRRLKREG